MAKVIGTVALAVIAIVALSALMGFLFMLLWNIVAPVFGLPVLEFVQSWALWVMISMVSSAVKGYSAK